MPFPPRGPRALAQVSLLGSFMHDIEDASSLQGTEYLPQLALM